MRLTVKSDKKGNQKLIKLNVKTESTSPENKSPKNGHKYSKRRAIKVNTPQPVKKDHKATLTKENGGQKPMIARRLIGNSSNGQTNGNSAKHLSAHSKPFAPNSSVDKRNGHGSRNESPSYRSKLLELTNERKLSKPEYQSYTTTSKHRSVAIYLSRVTVDSQYWSSHPTAVASPDDAEELAAKKAFAELSRRFGRQLGGNLPTQSDLERKALVDRVVSVRISSLPDLDASDRTSVVFDLQIGFRSSDRSRSKCCSAQQYQTSISRSTNSRYLKIGLK
jgi:hypothetical protein